MFKSFILLYIVIFSILCGTTPYSASATELRVQSISEFTETELSPVQVLLKAANHAIHEAGCVLDNKLELVSPGRWKAIATCREGRMDITLTSMGTILFNPL